jgi:hypothetical protein
MHRDRHVRTTLERASGDGLRRRRGGKGRGPCALGSSLRRGSSSAADQSRSPRWRAQAGSPVGLGMRPPGRVVSRADAERSHVRHASGQPLATQDVSGAVITAIVPAQAPRDRRPRVGDDRQPDRHGLLVLTSGRPRPPSHRAGRGRQGVAPASRCQGSVSPEGSGGPPLIEEGCQGTEAGAMAGGESRFGTTAPGRSP